MHVRAELGWWSRCWPLGLQTALENFPAISGEVYKQECSKNNVRIQCCLTPLTHTDTLTRTQSGACSAAAVFEVGVTGPF